MSYLRKTIKLYKGREYVYWLLQKSIRKGKTVKSVCIKYLGKNIPSNLKLQEIEEEFDYKQEVKKLRNRPEYKAQAPEQRATTNKAIKKSKNTEELRKRLININPKERLTTAQLKVYVTRYGKLPPGYS